MHNTRNLPKIKVNLPSGFEFTCFVEYLLEILTNFLEFLGCKEHVSLYIYHKGIAFGAART